jgi:hypothetical protein
MKPALYLALLSLIFHGRLMTVVPVDDAAAPAVTDTSVGNGTEARVGSLNSRSIESGRTMMRAT